MDEKRLDDALTRIEKMYERDIDNATLQGKMAAQIASINTQMQVLLEKAHAPATCPLTTRLDALQDTVIQNYQQGQKDVDRLGKTQRSQKGMSKKAITGVVTAATAGAVGIIEGITTLVRTLK